MRHSILTVRWAGLVGGLCVALQLCGPSRALAADREIGFELYSWKTGPDWYFSILEGTATVRSLEAIKSPKVQLRGTVFLKGRLASLPTGETLYWRTDKNRGLALPPQEIIHDIARFAATSQIHLMVAGKEYYPPD